MASWLRVKLNESSLLTQRNVLCLNRNHLFRSIRLRFAHNALPTERNLPNWLVREQLMEAIKANLLSHQIGSFSQRSRYWSRFVTPGRRAKLAAAAACLDDLEAFLEQFLEFLDRAAFPQHVPRCARHLDLLGFGQVTTVDQGALHAVAAQPGAGHLGVIGERDLELLTVLRAIPRDLTRRQVVITVGLVAHGPPKPAAPHDAISHHQHSSLQVTPRPC